MHQCVEGTEIYGLDLLVDLRGNRQQDFLAIPSFPEEKHQFYFFVGGVHAHASERSRWEMVPQSTKIGSCGSAQNCHKGSRLLGLICPTPLKNIWIKVTCSSSGSTASLDSASGNRTSTTLTCQAIQFWISEEQKSLKILGRQLYQRWQVTKSQPTTVPIPKDFILMPPLHFQAMVQLNVSGAKCQVVRLAAQNTLKFLGGAILF